MFVICFAINGFGLAVQVGRFPKNFTPSKFIQYFDLKDAQANGFVASLKDNAETKMGLLHAAYGASIFCAPVDVDPGFTFI